MTITAVCETQAERILKRILTMLKSYTATLLFTFLTLCVALPSAAANLTVSKLEEGIYLFRSEREVEGFGLVRGNGLIVKTSDSKAVLIDTPWDNEDVDTLFAWLSDQELSLEAVIATHSHDDAGGHLARFHQKNIPSWAYTLTNDYFQAQGETPALNTFNDSAWVVPDEIEVFYPGAGHTLDNSVVWVKSHNLLFGGCFIRELATSSLGYTAEGDVQAWPDSISRVVQRFPAIEVVVPGHGDVGSQQLLTHTQALGLQQRL